MSPVKLLLRYMRAGLCGCVLKFKFGVRRPLSRPPLSSQRLPLCPLQLFYIDPHLHDGPSAHLQILAGHFVWQDPLVGQINRNAGRKAQIFSESMVAHSPGVPSLKGFRCPCEYASVATPEGVAGLCQAVCAGVRAKGRSSSIMGGNQTQGCTVPLECAFALSSYRPNFSPLAVGFQTRRPLRSRSPVQKPCSARSWLTSVFFRPISRPISVALTVLSCTASG
ncbi:MAG: hypothetical protein [Caudoviricetes sp.]|nr:MAG: hypothetical protein [Caudoviricetes sp.]